VLSKTTVALCIVVVFCLTLSLPASIADAKVGAGKGKVTGEVSKTTSSGGVGSGSGGGCYWAGEEVDCRREGMHRYSGYQAWCSPMKPPPAEENHLWEAYRIGSNPTVHFGELVSVIVPGSPITTPTGR
jgi:hypothetical protein